MKRSRYCRVTLKSKILRYMRISRSISMREAGRRCNLSDSSINHYEHGRMEISEDRLEQLVECYGYTLQAFNEYMSGKPLPIISIKDECIKLLNRVDETKLKAIHAVLTSFVSN